MPTTRQQRLQLNFLACYFWYRSEKQKGFLASLGISLTFLVFVWTLLTGFNLERSICHETAQLTAREPSRKVIFTTYLGLPSLPFYVGKKNVYEFEKEWNIEKLVLRFSSSEPLFLLISEEDFKDLEKFRPFIKQQQQIEGFISDRGIWAKWILIQN